jgi:hypothetical protein
MTDGGKGATWKAPWEDDPAKKTSAECGCSLIEGRDMWEFKFVFCPLHESAPQLKQDRDDLRAALERRIDRDSGLCGEKASCSLCDADRALLARIRRGRT